MSWAPVMVISSWSDETQAKQSERERRKGPGGYSIAEPLHYLSQVVGTGHIFKQASCGRLRRQWS